MGALGYLLAMDDPHQLRVSDRPDETPVELVLEVGRAVLLGVGDAHEVAAVHGSGALTRYLSLMTHPDLIDHTALRRLIEAESEDAFYAWFAPDGSRAGADDGHGDYRFDVEAYAETLRLQWQTDGCIVAETRRDDETRGYVTVGVVVRLPLGAVRRAAADAVSGWSLRPAATGVFTTRS